jgi:hypothetical protein
MERQVLSGSELEEALRSGSLNEPSFEIEGMVRVSEKLGIVQIAPGGCETWIELPVELIEHSERSGDRPCRDRIYPVFKIRLIEPSDPVSQMLLAALLSALASVPH